MQQGIAQSAAGVHQVALSGARQFVAATNETLLAAAARAGIAMAYSCKTGRCSTCKCKVLSGTTVALQDETGLSASEQSEGWILSCVRAASSDVVIDAEDLGSVTLPVAKTLPCRIASLAPLAADVMRVQLRLPPTAGFTFIPGQYVDIIGPSGQRRSYSLASPAGAGAALELHIRAVDDGHMSDYWFRQAQENDLLRLNGPLGTFFLRDCAGMDLVFLATGTGIAPVIAMIASLPDWPAHARARSVTVVWGARTASDLYCDIAALPGDHHFIPVLSRAPADWQGARGHVQDVLIAHMPDLSNAAVYACGSDAMIHSASQALAAAGLPGPRFYSDAFVCSAAPSP